MTAMSSVAAPTSSRWKQVIATLQVGALAAPQWRDPKTGKPSRGKRNRLVRTAMIRDMVQRA